MIEDTLSKLETRLRGLPTLPDEKKAELTGLFAKLREEVEKLPGTRADDAESIASFAALSAHEATRAGGNPELRDLSLEGLATSVEDFEASHPRLVQVVNSICTSLANLGI